MTVLFEHFETPPEIQTSIMDKRTKLCRYILFINEDTAAEHNFVGQIIQPPPPGSSVDVLLQWSLQMHTYSILIYHAVRVKLVSHRNYLDARFYQYFEGTLAKQAIFCAFFL